MRGLQIIGTTALTAVAALAFMGCSDSGGVFLNTDILLDTSMDRAFPPDVTQDVEPPDLSVPDTTPAPKDTSLQDGMVCRPGDTQCVGSVFLACLDDGSDWDSTNCPTGTTCTLNGCEGQSDAILPPPEDVIEPADDVVQPPQDNGQTDTMEPSEDVPQPPEDIVEPGCGGGPPCPEGEECCILVGGEICAPEGQCPGPPQGCKSDADCDPGLKCCPGNFPGSPNQCKTDCGGNPIDQLPTCDTDADCVGGQTCVDIMGWTALCLSECAGDEDCGQNQVCQEIGGFGYVLAQVCDCATDSDCGLDLKCCNIPLINQQTCMTQCVGF
ncbi:MAG: hypothetical protein GXP54_02745 [Deltaproteobacteria bacterium]|nr:hypothetical protein [Deltaproteobacteria bacterium]